MDGGGIRGLSRVGYAAFLLIGATTVLVPALVVYVERTFGVADADLGIFYFVTAVSYAAGSFFGGMLTERFGRRRVLTVAALLTAAGLGGEAVAPSWAVFLVFAVPQGVGAGGIDGGVNGLFMAIFTGARGGALNMLHLFFALGALIAPIVVGTLVSGGLAWQVPLAACALIAVAIGALLATRPMPSGRHGRHSGHVAPSLDGDRLSRWPFVLLAAAICLYVASETGISNWVVRFLESRR